MIDEKEKEVLDKVHDYEFKMLCKLDEVCRKYSITYFLEAGTLIGAARHKDFVPWDDDVDIYFKRKDYEKLLEHQDELAPYFIHIPNPEENFFWDFTARLMDKRVLLKKDDEESEFYNHTHCQYIFFDLFIMDNNPGGIRGKLQMAELTLLYIFATSRRYKNGTNESNSPMVRFAIYIISRFGKLFSFKYIFKRYDKVSRRFAKKKDCEFYFLSNVAATFMFKSIYKKQWYRTRKELPVRDRMFIVPGGYVESLTSYYGDYMQLPPEKDRHPEHIEYFEDVSIND